MHQFHVDGGGGGVNNVDHHRMNMFYQSGSFWTFKDPVMHYDFLFSFITLFGHSKSL